MSYGWASVGQGLDEIIQLAIVDAVDEFGWIQGQEERPRPVLVLASGDANPGEFSKRGCALHLSFTPVSSH